MLIKHEQLQLEQLCTEYPALKAHLEHLEQAHQFQLSQISHEIRNPVTLINSFLQLFAASNPEVTTQPYWNEITENMQYLRALLTELSSYNNSKTLHRKTANLYKLLESIVKSATPALLESDIQLHLIKQTPIPSFDIDELKLRQVFLNLIRNAQEAMPQGGSITITIKSEDNTVLIKVEDTGCGIPVEYMPTLFQSFVTHKKDGTGLGLAIVQNVITAHNGSIEAQSHPGQGTAFIVRLPVFFL